MILGRRIQQPRRPIVYNFTMEEPLFKCLVAHAQDKAISTEGGSPSGLSN